MRLTQKLLKTMLKSLPFKAQFDLVSPKARDLAELQMIRKWRLDRSWLFGKKLSLIGVVPIVLAIYLNDQLFVGKAGQLMSTALGTLACLMAIFAVILHHKKTPSFSVMYIGGILIASLSLYCQASWLNFSLAAENSVSGAQAIAGFVYAAGGFFLAFSVFSIGLLMPLFMTLHTIIGILIWHHYEPTTIAEWTAVIADSDIFATALFLLTMIQSNEMAYLEQSSRELGIQNNALNLRQMETDLEIAQITHDSLTPPPEIQWCGNFEVRTYRVPFGLLGGDWLACQKLGEDSLVIAIGDASGKGVQAAMVVQSVQTLWARHLSKDGIKVDEFLQAVGRSLYNLGQRHPLTMTMGLVLIQGDQIFYYSAGHIPLALIQDKDVRLFSGVGNILGEQPHINFEPVQLPAPSQASQSYTVLFGSDGALPWNRRRRPKSLIQLQQEVQKTGQKALESQKINDDQILVMISHRDLLRRSA